MNQLSCITQSTNDNPTASVIWLHGLGASGHDFAGIVPELNLPESLGVRFIFPHAPPIPVTVNQGYVMPAWYDILEMSHERKINHEQLHASVSQVRDLIQQEQDRGIPSQRIILAGFSQGGAVALEAALSHEQPLGGLLALSTYFPTRDTITYHEANRSLNIEIHHGSLDAVVPESLAQITKETLKENGYKLTYRHYPMEHAVCLEQVRHLGQTITEQLS